MDSDDFVVESVDFCGSGDVLTSFAFILKVGLGSIRCLLISREFTAAAELGKVRELFEGWRWGEEC